MIKGDVDKRSLNSFMSLKSHVRKFLFLLVSALKVFFFVSLPYSLAWNYERIIDLITAGTVETLESGSWYLG